MRILFTGASCFTGMWMVKELFDRGHEVVATFQQELSSYQGMHLKRVQQSLSACTPVFGVSFGDDRFCKVIQDQGPFDLFCHHGAFVTDYKSPDFDFSLALTKNTHRIREVLGLLKQSGCESILLTGTVFEQREGVGSKENIAVSPYGLSKGLTSDVFAFFTDHFQMRLKKFVIPNPFGPFEEVRFTTFLAKEWLQGRTPEVTYPSYVRDNIPVSLLAKSYASFAENNEQVIHPSGFAELQGAFVERFSKELSKRLFLPCAFVLKEQTVFDEPRVRVNQDKLDEKALGFNESAFWDSLATFYVENYGQ